MAYVSLKKSITRSIKNDIGGKEIMRTLVELEFDSPATQSVSGILSATALTAVAQEITENITQPDIPRSVKIKGNASENAGNVVITGTNNKDEVITETIALNGDAEVLGNKAFKTITSIDLPAETHEGTDTVSVGTANKLGLPYLLGRNTVLAAFRNDVREGTNPTVAVSTTEIESNTVLLSSALNGTNVVLYLII